VRSLTNYGAFVALEPGIDGLIHISDLSWTKKISHPSEVLQVGDEVEAEVLSVDTESKKITLGVKQLQSNPWGNIAQTLPLFSVVKGVVTKIAAFGAFIQLENGLEALIHVTELSDQAFGKVEDIVSVGNEVQAMIIRIDPEQKKIAASIKQLQVDKTHRSLDDIIIQEEERREEPGEEKPRGRKKKTKTSDEEEGA